MQEAAIRPKRRRLARPRVPLPAALRRIGPNGRPLDRWPNEQPAVALVGSAGRLTLLECSVGRLAGRRHGTT